MFVLTTVTRDCKNGDLYVSVDDNAYLTNINRYTLRKERSLQKIISKQPKPNTTAIGVCSETQVTHRIITQRSDDHRKNNTRNWRKQQ